MPNISELAREPVTEQLEIALRFCAVFMSEELAHELATPLRFLERLMTGLQAGTHPETEDIDVALGELVRLRSLVTTLRTAKPPPISPDSVVLAEVVEDARYACTRALGPGLFRFGSTVEPTWVVSAHHGALRFVIHAMTQAVLGDQTPRLAVDVEASATATSSDLVLTLTGAPDDGWGSGLLVPWNTKAPSALPLSIAWRIARAHGFRLECDAAAARRTARLVIPRSCTRCLRANALGCG